MEIRVWQPRTATRDADRVDRATLFQQHIQPVRERKGNALENRNDELHRIRIRTNPEEHTSGVRVIVGRALS